MDDLPSNATEEEIGRWFKNAAKTAHPDHEGSEEAWHALIAKRDEALARLHRAVTDPRTTEVATYQSGWTASYEAKLLYREKRGILEHFLVSRKQRLRVVSLVLAAIGAILVVLIQSGIGLLTPVLRRYIDPDLIQMRKQKDLVISAISELNIDIQELQDTNNTINLIIRDNGALSSSFVDSLPSELNTSRRILDQLNEQTRLLANLQYYDTRFTRLFVFSRYVGLRRDTNNEIYYYNSTSLKDLAKDPVKPIFLERFIGAIDQENKKNVPIRELVKSSRFIPIPPLQKDPGLRDRIKAYFESNFYHDIDDADLLVLDQFPSSNFLLLPDVRAYKEIAESIRTEFGYASRSYDKMISLRSETLDRLSDFCAGVLGAITLFAGGLAAMCTYQLTRIDDALKVVDDSMNSKHKVLAVLREFLGTLPDEFLVEELTAAVAERITRGRSLPARYLAKADLRLLLRAGKYYVSATDLAELFVAKGIALGVLEKFDRDNTDAVRPRRAAA
jgi:hypothetical protein